MIAAGLFGDVALAMAVLDFPDSDDPSAMAAPFVVVAVFIAVRFSAMQSEPGLVLACLPGVAAATDLLAASKRAMAAVTFVGVASVGWVAYLLGRKGPPGRAPKTSCSS